MKGLPKAQQQKEVALYRTTTKRIGLLWDNNEVKWPYKGTATKRIGIIKEGTLQRREAVLSNSW